MCDLWRESQGGELSSAGRMMLQMRPSGAYQWGVSGRRIACSVSGINSVCFEAVCGLPPIMSAGRSSAPQQPEAPRTAPSGRLYAAQAEDPAVPTDVVTGIILIKGIRARALFDTGASNSFIGMSFAKSHEIEMSDSPDPWWVYAPEHTFSVTKECLACPVQVGEWVMPVDLLVLKRMWGFDLILGVDWLSKYYASIDCESKVITFREPGQEELVY
uniref:Uncharacterized protein n=1 Tax=Ananas comosus var. bracteatus TaxID=296719 RepID=A0A6V7PEW2_ANACO|nr:unnamed protein product [Ananas comosus var. bracteatus]